MRDTGTVQADDLITGSHCEIGQLDFLMTVIDRCSRRSNLIYYRASNCKSSAVKPSDPREFVGVVIGLSDGTEDPAAVSNPIFQSQRHDSGARHGLKDGDDVANGMLAVQGGVVVEKQGDLGVEPP